MSLHYGERCAAAKAELNPVVGSGYQSLRHAKSREGCNVTIRIGIPDTDMNCIQLTTNRRFRAVKYNDIGGLTPSVLDQVVV
jgi:hypothetical protein